MMEQNRQGISCAEVRGWDMVTFLSRLGYEPLKIRGNNYWYLSPLRDEQTASFKVDRTRNRWYDFGEGRGGSLIDFGISYYRCSMSDFLRQLNGDLSFPGPVAFTSLAAPDKAAGKIVIESVQPLAHPALLQYVASRRIPLSLASHYCQEVTYQNQGKAFFAIGFKNNSGGYELRSRYFKGGSSPKDYTLIQRGHTALMVFEGFFDFLSCLALFPEAVEVSDFLILNSLSIFNRATAIIADYRNQDLFLDNNMAGRTCTQKAMTLLPHAVDRAYLYERFEDLNDFLCDKPVGQLPGKDGPALLRPP